MPTFEITSPDGRKFVVEGPEGSTAEQARDRVRAQIEGGAGQQPAPTPQAAPQAPQAAPSWAEVPVQAVVNAPASAKHLAAGLYEMVTSPVQTAKAALDIGAGALRNLAPEAIRNLLDRAGSDPETSKRIEDAAAAAGGMLKERYGSSEALRRTLATDPVGAAADISMLFTGAGGAARAGGAVAAKAPGMVGRAGEIAARTGEAVQQAGASIDPVLAAARAAGKTAELGGRALGATGSAILGTTTGAGQTAIREAARTGAEGGQAAETFRAHMRGQAPISDVVDEARKGIEGLRAERQAMYQSNMASVRADPAVLNFNNIDSAISDSLRRTVFKGQPINERGMAAINDMAKAINEWKQLDPVEFHTPIGMDALKQKLGEIWDAIPYDERRAKASAGEIYSAVKSEIMKQAPEYGKAMKDYENATALLREIETALSAKEKVSIDTQTRKLQSIMRNNAITNWGQREKLARTLERYGASDLFPTLAGQALASPMPRGLTAGLGTYGGGIAALATNPAALPALALGSPRLVGETVHGASRGVATARDIARALQNMPGAQYAPRPITAARIGSAVERYQQEQPR